MSAIGGPGGIGGPKGPSGPGGPEQLDDVEGADAGRGLDGPSGPAGANGAEAATAGQAAQAAASTSATADLDRIAADLSAGRLTPHEAVDQLVAGLVDTETLPAADRAELRELMTDLLASDPHLSALVGRLG